MDLSEYFVDFNNTLKEFLSDAQNCTSLESAVEMIRQTREDKRKIILIGNGGSSAIAEHMAIDFTKNAGLRAIAFSGSPQLTTFANDYGYEHVFSKAIESHADKGDVLIAISSGGTSQNILNAVKSAQNVGCKIITLSAFEQTNPLRQTGDINIYLDSCAYGYIEIIHNLFLHFINDVIIGKAVYKIF